MPTTILLIRHAHVENPQNILYGRLPGFSLSGEGLRQAETLGRYLAVLPLAAVYSSPMLRAKQTAAAIIDHHELPTPRRSHLLNEALTSWQGKKMHELSGAWFYDPPCHPNDDSMLGIARRMERFMLRMVRRHRDETIAAISHGDPIAIYLLHLLGHELGERAMRANRTTYPDRASINRLVFDDDGALLNRHYETYSTLSQSLTAAAR